MATFPGNSRSRHKFRETRLPMNRRSRFLTLALSLSLGLSQLLSPVPQALAQASTATTSPSAMPRLVRFSGVVKDLNGHPLSGVVGITFALYEEQTNGAALWLETQNVTADSNGRYTALLGSTKPDALPAELFTSEQARWVGVQVSGQAEQPRVLLVSAPYAFKAGDAETIGGLPPSAFMLAAPAQGSAAAPPLNGSATSQGSAPPPAGAVTGTGTVNYLPMWDTTSDIISSVVFQSGSGAGAKIGINTATPASTLDVKGGSTIRGTLSLPATGNATATKGANSQPMTIAASAYNSGTSAAASQTFQWQAEPASNDTTTPSGTLNLLFGEGATKTSETGLHIASNGQITFAPGQTFPGTGTGTVTSVASGAGLTGGPITGSGTLSIATGGVSNSMLATPSLTITAGTDLTGGGVLTLGASTTLNLNLSATDARYSQLGASNTFTGTQTMSSSTGNAVSATSSNSTSSGLFGNNTAITGGGSGVYGSSSSSFGAGVEGSNLATSGNASGVYGVSSSSTGTGVYGIGNGAGVTGLSNSASGSGLVGVSSGSGGYGVFASNTANTGGGNGVLGQTSTLSGTGVVGLALNNAATGYGVYGQSSNSGVYGTGNGAGVTGTTSSTTGSGVVGVSYSTGGNGIYGQSNGSTNGSTGVYGNANTSTSAEAATYGVYGVTSSIFTGSAGVYGYAPGVALSDARIYGVYGALRVADSGAGVGGTGGTISGTGNEYMAFGAGVWGDADPGGYFGVFGTADDHTAVAAFNSTGGDKTVAALSAHNYSTTAGALVFSAQGGTALSPPTCTIDVSGNLNCTGTITPTAPASQGRQVKLYGVASPENWFEDFGSGRLSGGSTVVSLDPTFASTVNTGESYHVFLTPNGDCKGLYVASKTASGFEVREMSGGASSISFDYRIVAKRRGYENTRMEDVTEQMDKMRQNQAQLQPKNSGRPMSAPPRPAAPAIRPGISPRAQPASLLSMTSPAARPH
jgi:hypothetical protein